MYGDKGKAGGIELQDVPPPANLVPIPPPEAQNEVGETSGSNKPHSLDGLKKRLGSLRRKKKKNGVE